MSAYSRPHSSMNVEATEGLRRQRLLSDIHELVTNPYPKICLHPNDDNIHRACLVLYPDNYPPLHLSIHFPSMYPMQPPSVSMNSSVQHPNVYGGFICASILRVGEEYTPAYTIKGIAIQLLSFFDSESLEQEHSPSSKNLASYQDLNKLSLDTYTCRKCQFGMNIGPVQTKARPVPTIFDACVDHNPKEWPTIQGHVVSDVPASPVRPRTPSQTTIISTSTRKASHPGFNIDRMPNELLLLIIERLDEFEHLTSFARAWPRVSELIRDFDVIRKRELQCFCLKKGFQWAKLGVGVTVDKGQISSEFDLISEEAYLHMGVRHSIQHLRFSHWLPLPISRLHWNRVREDAQHSLSEITPHLKSASSSNIPNAHVLFTWMNDVVVRLNLDAEKFNSEGSKKSTLRHASEKAINSYFHLFHMLVCWATENPDIAQQADQLLRDFQEGKRSKTDCPNLGHLLIALLISDIQVNDSLIKSIITEAITRNVVWLLDQKGAGMAELSYMERDAVSAYRLDKTFQGSLTSYRLLMFSEIFRRTARPSHEKTLIQVRDELFDRYGAPPRDAAGHLAAELRRLHTIKDFPAFMKEMGLQDLPTPMNFTKVLRETVVASMNNGYSRPAINQKQAMRIRFAKDPQILLTKSEYAEATRYVDYRVLRLSYNFFPDKRGSRPNRGNLPVRR
ncbi:hypothetical protein FHL15_008098 [Xylaria flabelliformis]|uniref:UBC core domain-containing protein n=1 Tax=Xylaria flabelliformis TaxID=2512241 RepID=A0A553HSH2_9PEZI|nr:hypothetical protein FHL15_008098 [Xylaria flabelliformis]